MKRVASELDALDGPENEPNREFLVLQGVRFAFRVHQVHAQISHYYVKSLKMKILKDLVIESSLLCFQFAGGFDAESMKAFEELRSRIHSKTSENKMEE